MGHMVMVTIMAIMRQAGDPLETWVEETDRYEWHTGSLLFYSRKFAIHTHNKLSI